ncbi:IMP cyclohydrolase [archaeon]|nr:IMP cyclohydrolase [archaeon]
MPEKLQTAYKTILEDHFPPTMMIKLGNQELHYEKVVWDVPNEDGEIETAGLRYGDNPGQQAALFRLINGNLILGKVETIQPGMWLASDAELLQSGKHPGKTNITDADNALNILRHFPDQPVVSIHKHNNPCGTAIGTSILDAYTRANNADILAAYGGTIALNQPVDLATAEAIVSQYSEVVVAPDYEPGVMGILEQKKNLRVMRIKAMDDLRDWQGQTVLDFKSLIDGGLILQTSYVPNIRTVDDVKALPLGYQQTTKNFHQIQRTPTEAEYKDMWFGWLVESGITSNSVIYVKDCATVGIGTGEQDRVGAANIALTKAFEKFKDRLCRRDYGLGMNELKLKALQGDAQAKENFEHFDNEHASELEKLMQGATTVSDAFFPFRDGIDVGLQAGVRSVIQPGGSDRDYQSIKACNEFGATMLYTGQRSFKH